MVDAIIKELDLQQHYLGGETIQTIYFGGGTPSLLSAEQVERITSKVYDLHKIEPTVEITLEANPDDLYLQKLQELYAAGINRISMGIQSFDEEVLSYLNRAHNRQQAETCLEQARAVGFHNISIDLIYGIPNRDHEKWYIDLQKAVYASPEHISAYSLTIEPHTVFGRKLQAGKLENVDDEQAAEQFEIMLDVLGSSGYLQYEISNFCQPGYYSRHNSSYWQQKKYLGVGPSAHSYDLKSRQYNVSKNGQYLKLITEGSVPAVKETLNKTDQVNEYLLTSLRTIWGADLDYLRTELNYDLQKVQGNYLRQLLHESKAVIAEGRLMLTNSGKLFADRISSDLFKT